MGMFMLNDDIYIGILLERLNLRFGPTQIREMAVLQRKFDVFSQRHSFRDAVDLLGLGGYWNANIKRKWGRLLNSLKKAPSDRAHENGDRRIVSAMRDNLTKMIPAPVHFAAHDLRRNPRVTVRHNTQPIVYMDQRFITISLPMKPHPLRVRSTR
jgi:hypothetical protein